MSNTDDATATPIPMQLGGLGQALAALLSIRRAIAAAVPTMPKLPHTTFRCARCGHDVGSFTPRLDGPNFRTNLACPDHGALQDPSDCGWQAKWTRQGKPDHITLRLPPM